MLYQWRKEGFAILDATNSSLSLTGVTTNDAGRYDVVVTNAVGTATSTPAVLQVLPYGAPSIRMNGQLAVGSFSVAQPETITVSLTGGFTNGFIFYTLDGTEPNLGSTYYDGPFTLSNSAIVVAMSLSADLEQTAVSPGVKALILPTYGLSTAVSGSGAIAVSPAQAAYPSNSLVSLTAQAGLHFAFDHWTGDLAGGANPASLVMNGPRSVQAVFVPGEYPLTLSASAGGVAKANGQSIAPETWFPVGGVVSLEATPDAGWGFLRWEGTANSTNNPLLLPMNQTNIVQAIFGTTSLTVGTPGGGVVSVNGQGIAPGTQYPPGTVVSLAATPNSGWSFLRWAGTVSSSNNPLSLTMSGTQNVQAVFSTTVRLAIAGSGNILFTPTNPVPYGTTITATAVPGASYAFLAWSGAVSGNMNPTTLTVTNASPLVGGVFTGPPVPVVVTHPTNQLVVQGQNAELVVTASGANPLRYQWRKETNVIAQATNATLLLTNVTTADAGHYDVVVTNIHGSATSAVALLTVVVPPSVVVQPTNVIVAAGGMAALSVTAGGTEPLSYQWLMEGGVIQGATNATLMLSPAQLSDAGNYRVAITNFYGATTSAVAVVAVFIPVAINVPPTLQAVSAGGTAMFQVGATGFPAPNYQWLFKGDALPGANGSSLVITNVGTNALGGYAVAVWNAYSATTSAPVQLVMLPSVRTPFVGATVVWGKPATVSVSALGSAPLAYQWFKDGSALMGATNAVIEFAAVQISDGGLYSVVVSNPYGTVTNAPAQLVVNPANIALGMYAGVTIEGVPGFTYGIQYTTDLRDTNSWITATNLTLSEAIELWVDRAVNVQNATNARRYYRVLGQ